MIIQNRQFQRFGCIAVGQSVEFQRLDDTSKDEPTTIRTRHIVKGIHEFESGVIVTLKGDASTIVQAFDAEGHVLAGVGKLEVLQEVSSESTDKVKSKI